MNDYVQPSETSDPPVAGVMRDADVASRAHRPTVRQLLSTGRKRRIVAIVAVALAAGLSVGVAAAPSTTAASKISFAGGPGFGGGGSNARSGPAPGGAAGTVRDVSTSSFTLSTSAGQQVLVDEAPSTTYQNRAITASGVATGEGVLVLGTTSGTTITATQVIVEPTGVGGTANSSSSAVTPFKRGAPTTSKQEGQIPANWSQGSGTIVGGTAADKAIEAALAAYPGGIVDRVVKLSNGEYNVHYIGVDWPHHVFVNQAFKVVGAE